MGCQTIKSHGEEIENLVGFRLVLCRNISEILSSLRNHVEIHEGQTRDVDGQSENAEDPKIESKIQRIRHAYAQNFTLLDERQSDKNTQPLSCGTERVQREKGRITQPNKRCWRFGTRTVCEVEITRYFSKRPSGNHE